MKRAPVLSLTILLAVLGWSPSAGSQTAAKGVVATVTAVRGRVEVRGVGFEPGTELHGKETLRIATQLIALSPNATVELTCTNGAVQLLSNQFDMTISKQEPGVDCAVDLSDGDAFATTNPPAGENGKATIHDKVGLTDAQAKHTQFGVSVRRNDPAASAVYVVEGSAIVTNSGKSRDLSAGLQFVVKESVTEPVPPARYRAVAVNMASIDLQRAGNPGDKVSLEKLQAAYESALRSPNDPKARRALTDQYKALKIPESSISRYNSRMISEMSKVPGAGAMVPSPPTAVAAFDGGGAPPAASKLARIYEKPTVGDVRVDFCLRAGQDCGMAAANAFCKLNGHSRAVSFTEARDKPGKGATLSLGEKQLCRGATCHGFESISCN